MKKIVVLVAAALLCATSIFAQRTVSGTVTDTETGETLPSVNVYIKGTTKGTVTSLDGSYTIEVPEGEQTLVFSFVGYEDQEKAVPAGGDATIDIALGSGDVGLNTVVVSASKREEKILDAPASVSVISSEEIENSAAITPTDHLKTTPGVDFIQTGLISANVNIRGFNNIFSGAMLTIVDNRIARVPSLRVNAFQLIPTNNYDIDRMEVVRGPGSALYGPNATDGVLAIWTKSPLDYEKRFNTVVSFSGGNRGVINPEIYHAGKINDKIGYKISASYFQGNDWEYYDPREPEPGDSIIFGSVQNGEVFQPDTNQVFYDTLMNNMGMDSLVIDSVILDGGHFDRNFEIRKYSADARFDFRPTDDISIILNGGFAATSNLELTGLGAAQGKNWVYSYGQIRFNWKKLFVQYFINSSNSGDTYLIPQVSGDPPYDFQYLTDKSKLHTAQIQHSYRPIDRLNFIYGVDVLLTRPDTEGTINGRFEDDDNITQIGGYIQGELDINEQLSVTAATRADYHNKVDGIFWSPRGAIVYKPATRHTLRATYNRAFSPPSTLNLSLDLSNGRVPNGINIRALGNPDGYDYVYNDQGIAQYNSPFVNGWYDVGQLDNNHVYFDGIMGVVSQGLASETGFAPNIVDGLVGQLTRGIAGDTGTIQNVGHSAVDFVQWLEIVGEPGANPEDVAFDPASISDAPPVDNSVTQTFEIGYKGILFDKLFVTADFYYSRISDYVSPLVVSSASVIFTPSEMQAALGTTDAGQLRNNLDAEFAPGQTFDEFLVSLGFLDGNPSYGGTANGTVWDEVANIITGATSQIPFGSVTPDDPLVNNDVILIYRNLGTINVGGMDLSFRYLINDEFSVSGAYSYVTDDRFELEGAQGGYIALNAPKHKTNWSVRYSSEETGLTGQLAYRWQAGFPANSAVYVGEVQPGHFLDANLSYNIPKTNGLSVGVHVTNLTNNKISLFPGTPKIGTMVLGKIKYRFTSKN